MKGKSIFQLLFSFILMAFLLLPYFSVSAMPGDRCNTELDCLDIEGKSGNEICEPPNPPGDDLGTCKAATTGSGAGTGNPQGSGAATGVPQKDKELGGGYQELINPLTGEKGDVPFTEIIKNVITALAGLAAVLALLGFVWGGVTWITAYGSEQKITRGKQMLTWSFIGLIVVFGSYGFINFILTALIGAK